MINLVMLVSISNLAKTFSTAILALKRLFGNMSSHVIVQFMKIVENQFAFLELAVIESVVLSVDADSALFEIVY